MSLIPFDPINVSVNFNLEILTCSCHATQDSETSIKCPPPQFRTNCSFSGGHLRQAKESIFINEHVKISNFIVVINMCTERCQRQF